MKFVPSLRMIGALYAGVVTFIILVASGYVLFDLYREAQRQGAQRVARDLDLHSHHVAQLVEFYQHIAERLSRQSGVIDLALFGDPAMAQQWSASLRAHLPDITGLALFSADGNILGESAPQRVGQLCVHDMHRLVSGVPAPRFPLHSERAGLEHVDITAAVKDGEVTVGVVFLSLSLNRLQQALDDIAAAGQKLSLYGPDSGLIARIDRLGDEPDPYRMRGPVAGTPWSLELVQRGSDSGYLYRVLIPATVGAALAAIALIMFLVRSSTRLFTGELDRLHATLEQVAEGTPLDSRQRPRLRELQPIVPAIHALASQIQDTQKRLAVESVTDALTLLPNRRRFEDELERAFAAAKRGRASYLALIDLDNFKDINDGCGHEAGDKVLRHVAEALQQNSRANDLAARVGGDEFAAIIADSSSAGVQQWFERVREQIRSRSDAPSVTISVGFTALGGDRYDEPGDAMRAADAALYRAKGGGRDRAAEA